MYYLRLALLSSHRLCRNRLVPSALNCSTSVVSDEQSQKEPEICKPYEIPSAVHLALMRQPYVNRMAKGRIKRNSAAVYSWDISDFHEAVTEDCQLPWIPKCSDHLSNLIIAHIGRLSNVRRGSAELAVPEKVTACGRTMSCLVHIDNARAIAERFTMPGALRAVCAKINGRLISMNSILGEAGEFELVLPESPEARAPVNNLAGAILSMALERAYVPSGAHVSETGTHANGDFYVDVKISRSALLSRHAHPPPKEILAYLESYILSVSKSPISCVHVEVLPGDLGKLEHWPKHFALVQKLHRISNVAPAFKERCDGILSVFRNGTDGKRGLYVMNGHVFLYDSPVSSNMRALVAVSLRKPQKLDGGWRFSGRGFHDLEEFFSDMATQNADADKNPLCRHWHWKHLPEKHRNPVQFPISQTMVCRDKGKKQAPASSRSLNQAHRFTSLHDAHLSAAHPLTSTHHPSLATLNMVKLQNPFLFKSFTVGDIAHRWDIIRLAEARRKGCLHNRQAYRLKKDILSRQSDAGVLQSYEAPPFLPGPLSDNVEGLLARRARLFPATKTVGD